MDPSMTGDAMMLDSKHASINNHTNGFIDPRHLNHQMQGMELTNNVYDDAYDSSDVDQDPSVDSEPDDGPSPRRYFLPTGFCYDDRMRLHAIADWTGDESHPESPARIDSIYKELKNAKLIYDGDDITLKGILRISPTAWMWRIIAREATREEILLCHGGEHFDWVQALSKKSARQLREMTQEMDKGRKSLYVGNLTYEASLVSVGAAIETCKSVVVGAVKNAIAIIRPPGHHAEHDTAMGFCLFNNVAVAARVCQTDYPKQCRKILILDWDVHHGNGVQNIFYEDPNILYISLHVYKNGQFYPDPPEDSITPDGGPSNVGSGLGIGRNVNIGWHDQGMGDGEYLAAFQRIVMPIAQEFNPDLVIVSAGFDAAEGDELGGCHVSPTCYAHMTHMLMSLANGKVAVCLEGGYNLRAIARSALAVAKTLMGEPPPRMDKIPPICKAASLVLEQVAQYQAPYWDCMRSNLDNVRVSRDLGGVSNKEVVRMSEVVRAWQTKVLTEEQRMISMYVQKERLAHSFANQVLVTKELSKAKKIMMIIHDPPTIVGSLDSFDNTMEAHNTWLTDGVMPYINWAVAHDFGVIDVNVPMNGGEVYTSPLASHFKNASGPKLRPLFGASQRQLTSNMQDPNTLIATLRPSEEVLSVQLKELVCYLWDNYLEGYESNEIVVMGVGDSYLAVKLLLTNRDCTQKISSIINFVSDVALRPVKSERDPSLSQWYKQHSRIFCAADHLAWADPTLEKRVGKNRFGTVIRSPVSGLSRMMMQHRQQVFDFLERNEN